jgi:ubiquinone/menaquinone biosynthesis C-methylase UbiE
MKNSIENNLKVWDKDYDWPKDGDEWDEQARSSHHSYEEWKRAVVETFIAANVSSDSTVLEIAPGHGRWSSEIVNRCKALYLVDLSPSCIDYCKRRFAKYSHIQYIVNDGQSLDAISDACIDFVWSYDSFVHMEADVIGPYFKEIYRVLKRGRKAVIHHAGRRHPFLWLGFLRYIRPSPIGRVGKHVYKVISMGEWLNDDGWRSNVSATVIRSLAEEHGLRVQAQVRYWGQKQEYGVPRCGDYISVLLKP